MSSIHAVDRSAVATQNARSAVAPKHDRVSLCTFTFADGRRCRTPRQSAGSCFCYFHARKEAQARASGQTARDISLLLTGGYVSAHDLSLALGRLFVSVVEGHVKPRQARTLAYLGQVLLQAVGLSQKEFVDAFGANSWSRVVASTFNRSGALYSPPSSTSASAPTPSSSEPAPPPKSPAETSAAPPSPASPPKSAAPAPKRRDLRSTAHLPQSPAAHLAQHRTSGPTPSLNSRPEPQPAKDVFRTEHNSDSGSRNGSSPGHRGTCSDPVGSRAAAESSHSSGGGASACLQKAGPRDSVSDSVKSGAPEGRFEAALQPSHNSPGINTSKSI